MIDSHCHSSFSKHAIGSLTDVVEAALSVGVKVLTITDHAPFPVDKSNRLLEEELDIYITEIEKLKEIYSSDIVILSGFEMDFMPGYEKLTRSIIQKFPIDFVIGSIHYISVQNYPLYKVWELSRLNDKNFLDGYFKNLELLIQSGLFDAVGHLDSVLRAIPEEEFLDRAEPLITLLSKNQIAYELNTSGLRKTTLDMESGEEIFGKWSYPSLKFMKKLLAHEIKFTIGSDAHEPKDVGAGLQKLIEVARIEGLKQISYFKNRKRIDVSVDDFFSR